MTRNERKVRPPDYDTDSDSSAMGIDAFQVLIVNCKDSTIFPQRLKRVVVVELRAKPFLYRSLSEGRR